MQRQEDWGHDVGLECVHHLLLRDHVDPGGLGRDPGIVDENVDPRLSRQFTHGLTHTWEVITVVHVKREKMDVRMSRSQAGQLTSRLWSPAGGKYQAGTVSGDQLVHHLQAEAAGTSRDENIGPAQHFCDLKDRERLH